tara:strand:- start:43 stop:531 length:489 start_codon:yes stop_codon:yes gene_type:complete
MKKYTKPQIFFAVIIIILSFILSVYINISVKEYLPKTNFFGEVSFDERHQGNIFRGFFFSIFWFFIAFGSFFVISIFKKKFALIVLKTIFEYPWKPYYSFWLFFLLVLPIIFSLIFFIIDAINYFIFISYDLSSSISGLLSSVLFFSFLYGSIALIDKIKKK